jgi:hypothetical protein
MSKERTNVRQQHFQVNQAKAQARAEAPVFLAERIGPPGGRSARRDPLPAPWQAALGLGT